MFTILRNLFLMFVDFCIGLIVCGIRRVPLESGTSSPYPWRHKPSHTHCMFLCNGIRPPIDSLWCILCCWKGALLPPGQWDLHFDEEGFGFVESHSSDEKNESLWVNDLFRRCLYKTDGGREVVLQSTAAGGEHAVSTFLSEQLLDFEAVWCEFPWGTLQVWRK